MLNKIAGTIGTRMISSVLAFLIWIINARFLGPENVGTISLIIFSVAVVQLLTNFFCGAAVIYYTSRAGVYSMMVPAYFFSILLAAVFTFFLTLLGRISPHLALIPSGYEVTVALLTMIISMASANYNLLLGLEWVKKYNYLSLIQVALAMLILLLLVVFAGFRTVGAYVVTLLVSWTITFIAGLFLLKTEIRRVPLRTLLPYVVKVLKFGWYVQLANIFQTFNYRISLKFTDLFLGRASVGILSVGMTLAEGFWIIGRSIATVQFSRLSNQDDFRYSVRLTMTLLKISGVITLLAIALLLCIPESLFLWMFSAKFGGIRTVICTLAAGIVILSTSMVLSGFFSGINKPFHNAISSAIGFVFTVILGFWLIPVYGLAGAGIAASMSYASSTLYQLVVFVILSRLGARDFLFRKTEFRELLAHLKQRQP